MPPSGSGGRSKEQRCLAWPHWSYMKWLEPYISASNSSSEVLRTSSISYGEDVSEVEVDENDNPSENETPQEEVIPGSNSQLVKQKDQPCSSKQLPDIDRVTPINSYNVRSKRKREDEIEQEILSLVKNMKQETDDDIYGRHIGKELANIVNPNQKQLAKLQIQEILTKAQFHLLVMPVPVHTLNSSNGFNYDDTSFLSL